MMSSESSSASDRRDEPVLMPHPEMKTSKICGVCGDAARCYHFGGLCCASCKAFFRRAVVNDQYKLYRCVYGGSCKIDVMTRKHCSHCRLNRCLSIGMEKKWFMSEEMRMELKLKSLKKQKIRQQNFTNPNDISNRAIFQSSPNSKIITSGQIAEIQSLVKLCRISYITHMIPESIQSTQCPSSSAATAIIFSTAIRRVFSFLENVPQLRQLDPMSRMVLFKERGMEALIVLSTLTFNPVKRMWEGNKSTLLAHEPCLVHVCAVDFEKLHGPHVTRKHLDTITALLNLNADEQIITILSLVAFFTLDDHQADGRTAASANTILNIQEHFIDLLKCYVRWKFDGDISEKIFARFILKLSDVREVNNLHKVERLRLSSEEIHQVEEQMGGVDLLKYANQH